MQIYVAIFSLIFGGICAFKIQDWRYGEKIQEARAEQSEAARKAMDAMQRLRQRL